MAVAYPLARDVLSEELAHDLFQLVFAYQLMAAQTPSGPRLDDEVQRDQLLACALRSYASLLRETHRDRDAEVVLSHALALSAPGYGPCPTLPSFMWSSQLTTGELMPTVVHFEIQANDPERVLDFYQGVFDWQVQKWEGPVDSWLLTTGEVEKPDVNGAIFQRPTPRDDDSVAAFVCTVDVPDLDGFLGRVHSCGGGVAVPKMSVPQVGWLVYCKDTEGNVFGMMQPDAAAA
jgi:uncharacterized protein